MLAVSEDSSELLRGQIFAELALLLLKCHDFETLRAGLSDRHPFAAVEAALSRLADLGIFAAFPQSDNPVLDAYWESAGVRLPESAAIAVHSLLPTGDCGLRRALAANGLLIEDDAGRAILLTDDYLRPGAAEYIARHRECLLAKPVGHTIHIGPLIRVDEAVCFNCLAHWLRANRPALCALSGGSAAQPALSALPSTVALGVSLIATAATLWIARGESQRFHNTIVTLDTRWMTWQHHKVRGAPGCRCTGREPPGSLEELASGVCGIVSNLSVSESRFAAVYCAQAQLAPPLPLNYSRPLIRHLPVAGRGTERTDAIRSCIGEAAERYSAIFQGSEHRITATLESLGDLAVNPFELFQFSESQYENRDRWNQRHSDLANVPERSETALEIDWTPIVSATGGPIRYVPTAYCYLWYPSTGAKIYPADSNGCGAGQDWESAALSALLELIERDSLAIWWENRVVRPQWDVDVLHSPQLSECREGLERVGRQLKLLDLTTDIGVPVCAAVGARWDGAEPFFATAAGATPVEAACGAAGELASLVWTGSGSEYFDWVKGAHLSEHRFMQPSENGPPPESPGLKLVADRLEWCVQRLSRLGMECGFLDLTRPELGVPVSRAIVPGLRHPWGRRGPGRLYDVPVRMGWLAHPVSEQDLNPSICML